MPAVVTLARMAIRRPRAAVGCWLAVIGSLGFIGLGVEDDLHRSDLAIAGSESAAASALTRAEFGENNSVSVLLEGPPPELARQGRALVELFERHDRVVVLSPWTPDAGGALRPARDQALLLVRADLPFEQVSVELVPELRGDLASTVEAPVEAHLTGFPDLAAAIHGGTVRALQRAELIAAPVLAIVLMLVFRSLVAAALPLLLGFATIGAGAGVLTILNRFVELDATALNLMTAMGLALGVDYSLLIVSRYREELDDGAEPVEAVQIAAGAAGGTVIFAGIALGIAVGSALIVAPGGILASSSTGALVAAAMSMFSALIALPAALVLLGRRIDRGRLGKGRSGQGSTRFALGIGKRPAVGIVVAIGLLLLCVPALSLESGAPNPRNLAASSLERQDFEAVRSTLGAGWAAPFEVTVSDPDGSISERADLRALVRWQRQIGDSAGVREVFGPRQIAKEARALRAAPTEIKRAGRSLERGERAAGKLERGTRTVDRGIDRLRGGTAKGAGGADRLASGIGDAAGGIDRLRSGVDRARSGADRFAAGIARGARGSRKLARGGKRLRDGAQRLLRGTRAAHRGTREALPKTDRLVDGLREGRSGLAALTEPATLADRELDAALDALDALLPTSKGDPRYRETVEAVATAKAAVSGRNPINGDRVEPGYDGLVAALEQGRSELDRAVSGAGRLRSGLGRLDRGLGKLEQGGERLTAGAEKAVDQTPELVRGFRRLTDGADRLDTGLGRLDDGGARLDRGAGRLRSGARKLAGGLDDGADRSRPLDRGATKLASGTSKFRDEIGAADAGAAPGDLEQLEQTFRSGNVVTAAIQQSSARDRQTASFVGNFDRGGSAAKLVVITGADPTDPEETVRDRLSAGAADFERETGTDVAVGGPGAVLQDFGTITSGRLPLLIVVLVLVTYVVLVPMFRSLLLPLLAVALNVVTVAAAFGVLVLAFGGDNPPFGGTGQLDSISVFLIFSVIFGLAIDYEVFLIMRMREGWLRFGDTDQAIEHGLRKTAGIVTGAALIMTGVFVAFALADLATVRQLGIGLTVAVLIDATLVRLVLLPAAMRLFGDANWWLPSWLDRALPKLAIH